MPDDVTRHEAIFPMGTNVSSKGRWRFCQGKPNGPKWITSAHGCMVTDQAGQEYIDLTAGLGCITLGHRVMSGTPQSYPLPSQVELRLADRIQAMIPWAQQMRFLKNGGDATTAAIRLARIATGRDMVVDFGNYHGAQDPWISDEHEGVPQVIRRLTLRTTPTTAALAFVDHTTAAVILEAAPLKPLPGDFLHALRARCSQVGAILIFDDIISGFRAHPQGAAGLSGVIPDLTCAGKAMGNRWPISVVYGHPDLMACWSRTHLSATHWAEPTAMEASLMNLCAMIDEGFWERQAAWSFGGQESNGHWAVLSLNPVEQTFVQSILIDKGILTNFSLMFYLDLSPVNDRVTESFAEALGALKDAKQRGDDIAKLLDCEVNRTVFRRN